MTTASPRNAETVAERIEQAYLQMVREVGYRPAAPGDGWGSIHLSAEELDDPCILVKEAREYRRRFLKEEDSLQFFLGCSNYETNRALVYVVEAARLLNSGGFYNQDALKLLQMAIAETADAIKAKEKAVFNGPAENRK